jgi:XTP/dITP diphosphohydrolase
MELVALDDLGIEGEPVEDAATFRGNAILKARFYAERSGLPTLADDSGLEVDALGGSPGVRTRRYASEHATDEENNAKLLAELVDLPPERRTARYRCVLAFLDPRVGAGAAPRKRPRVVTRSGTFRGRIATAPRGSSGFGYDPIFEPATEPPGGRTVGQLSSGEKNRVSHRAKAARAMARHLRTWQDPA